MNKVMDFSGSGAMLMAMIYDEAFCHALDAQVRQEKKVCVVVLVESEQPQQTEDDISDLGSPLEFDEERMDILGQNGPDGHLYEVLRRGDIGHAEA